VTITTITGRAAILLLVGCLAGGTALAEDGLGVAIAEDGSVDAARQCDVYVTGTATSRRPDPLSYRWLDGGMALISWAAVRADGSAPLELCGLAAGRHALTLEVTDGRRTVSHTMTATIVSAPELVARGDADTTP
jgi:hypothetical protein